MKTILLYATKKDEALQAVTVLCDFIKSNEEYAHQLYFSAKIFGAYTICRGLESADGREYVGNHEIIIFPKDNKDYELRLERTRQTKNVVQYANCMSIVGDSKIERVQRICQWLMDDNLDWTEVW